MSFLCQDLTSNIEQSYQWTSCHHLKEIGDDLKKRHNLTTIDLTNVRDNQLYIESKLILTFENGSAALFAVWLWQ